MSFPFPDLNDIDRYNKLPIGTYFMRYNVAHYLATGHNYRYKKIGSNDYKYLDDHRLFVVNESLLNSDHYNKVIGPIPLSVIYIKETKYEEEIAGSKRLYKP